MSRADHYVLTESAAHELGIIDDDGVPQRHDATLRQIARAAESTHANSNAAYDAARALGGGCYVIDESGDSHWVAP